MRLERKYKNSQVDWGQARSEVIRLARNGYIVQIVNAGVDERIFVEYFKSKEEYDKELKEMQESNTKPDVTKDNNLDIIDIEKMIDFVEERMNNVMIRNDDKFIRNAIIAVLEAREEYIKSEQKGGI